MADIIKIKLGANVYNIKDASAARKNVYYGTCTTAANTYKKVATVETFPLDGNGLPLVGTLVAIKYSNTNTYKTEGQTYQLNVNNTGDFPMYYNNAALATSTSANTLVAGYKNRHIFYMFNGSQWVWVTSSYDANTTYSGMTQAEVDAGTGTTARLITPQRLRDNFYTETEVNNLLAAKANSSDLATVATSGSYTDLSNKPTIPTKVSDLQNDSGFTTNTGTITGITMNGSSKGTSGVVDLGTVITSHQDISGKQDTLVSGTNIKTVNSYSVLGSGDLTLTASDVGAVTYEDLEGYAPLRTDDRVDYAYMPHFVLDGINKTEPSNAATASWNVAHTTNNQIAVRFQESTNQGITTGFYHYTPSQYVTYFNKEDYKFYRWTGSAMVAISSTAAYTGSYNDLTDKPTIPAAVTVDSSITSGSTNPVEGGAIYTALSNKQDTLISGTNIKTINSQSLLGEGNLTIANGSDGVGIASVVQTTTSTSSGGNNVITVTKTDNSTSTFTVKNGIDGANGVSLGEIALTQETGDSTSSVMSQAAVTESIEQSIQSTKSRQVVDPTKAIYTTITADSNATSMNTYLFDEIRKLDVVYRVAYGWNSVNYYSSGNLCSIYIDSNNFIRWRVDSYACYAEIKVNGTYLLQNSHTINSGSPQLNSRTQIAAVIDLIQNKMIIYGVDSGSMSIIYSYDISSYDISSFSGKQAKIITTIFSYNRSYYGVYVRVNKFLGLEDDLTRTIYASGYNAFPAYQKAPQFCYNNLINGLTLGGTVTQTITSTHKIISATNASGYFALAPKTSKGISYPNLFWTLNIKLLSGSISIGRSAASVIGGVYIYDSNMNQVSTIAQNTTYLMLVGALTRETAYAFSYALSVSGTFELEVWNPNLFNIQTQNICVDTWDGEYFTGTIPFKASPMFTSTTAVGSIQISNGNIQMWNGSVWKQINNS